MPLPSSGPLSLNDIQTEFGGTNPIGLDEYYAGGAFVPAGTTGTNGAVPSSGAISLFNFYGTTAFNIGTNWNYRGPVGGAEYFYNVTAGVSSLPATNFTNIIWNGSFLIGSAGTFISTCSDGTNWSVVNPSVRNLWTTPYSTSSWIRRIVWTGSLFCVVSPNRQVATSPDGITWTNRTGLSGLAGWTSGVTVSDMIWTGSQFVAIGGQFLASVSNYRSAIATSPDGITWTYVGPIGGTSGINNNPRIAFNGTTYAIASGTRDLLRRTSDLTTIFNITLGDKDGVYIGVAWSGTRFLAVNDDRYLATSSDGISWSETALRVTNMLTGIANLTWSSIINLFVARSDDSTSQFNTFTNAATPTAAIITTGATVTEEYLAIGINGSGVTFIPGASSNLRRATTYNGTYSTVTSTNLYGPTGASGTFSSGNFPSISFWTGSQFVLVGSSACSCATSPDGATWTIQAGLRTALSASVPSINSGAINGSIILVGGSSGRVATSTDNAVTWTEQTALRSTSWSTGTVNSATVASSLFCVAGTNRYATSPDGITWTYSGTKFVRVAADAGVPEALIWTGSTLVIGSTDGHVYTTSDVTAGGTAFTSVAGDLTSAVNFREFVWTGTTLIAATYNGMYSSVAPFSTWTRRDTNLNMESVAYDASLGKFVAVSLSGFAIQSTDGITWTSTELNSAIWGSRGLSSVTSNGTRFVASGAGASVTTSP